MDYPIDIQAELDKLLEENPDAQQYVSKIYYIEQGTPPPADATHILTLASNINEYRNIKLGVVCVEDFHKFLESILALVATQDKPGVSTATHSKMKPGRPEA